ncbi:MAG: TetR/AcrR family transcriptional regulator [Devosia sp.]
MTVEGGNRRDDEHCNPDPNEDLNPTGHCPGLCSALRHDLFLPTSIPDLSRHYVLLSRQDVSTFVAINGTIQDMPKLWNDTIEAHKSAVASAIMDKTAELAALEGLHTLTMARIAQEAGIGRATLYKYFSDVEGILSAWHKRQITAHLEGLERIRQQKATPLEGLEAVLIAYGENSRHGHDHAIGVLLHAMPHMQEAHNHLQDFLGSIIDEAVRSGSLEGGASSAELARYALAAIANGAPSKPALVRLVGLILRGLGA